MNKAPLLLTFAVILSACGTTSHLIVPTAKPQNLSATSYLAQIGELDASGFTVYTPASIVTATTAAQGNAFNGAALTAAGLKQAALVRFFRSSNTSILYVNGPVDVTSIAERFHNAGEAHNAFTEQTSWALQGGAINVSTGPLGDEASAAETSRVDTADNQTLIVQFTLTWRINTIVEVLIVRGRYGATSMSDVLYTAGIMDSRNL